MKFIKLSSMKGTPFAIPVDNIREVYAVDNHSIILTYDHNSYDCQLSCEDVFNLINNILSSEMNEVMIRVNKTYDYDGIL